MRTTFVIEFKNDKGIWENAQLLLDLTVDSFNDREDAQQEINWFIEDQEGDYSHTEFRIITRQEETKTEIIQRIIRDAVAKEARRRKWPRPMELGQEVASAAEMIAYNRALDLFGEE